MAEIQPPSGVGGDARAMALWARALSAKGKADQALAAGLAATQLAPDDPEVWHIVTSTLSPGAHGYHVPMLSDRPRNRSYGEALKAAIRRGMTVLEIGSGAGLLALMAAKAGARVYTCERAPVVAAAANLIAERNGLADRITIIPKDSSELRIGTDLPERADLLVSELFDNRLFGESVVQILEDAKPRLLKDDAVIIPPRAMLRCALSNTEVPKDREPLGEVEGFDLSPFNLLAPPSDMWLIYSASRSQILSEPVSALAKDFRGKAPFGPDEETVRLTSHGGEINSVVQWIRIEFDGGAYENDPLVRPSPCWGRPVHRLPQPLHTEPGQQVELHWRRIGSGLLLTGAIVAD